MSGKCWKCGKEINPYEYKEGMTPGRFCWACYCEHDSDHKQVLTEYLRLRNMIMFDRAMRIMEKAGVPMTGYKKFAVAVQKHSADNPDQYKSSYEMVAAVILLAAGVDFDINKKIGTFIVDFYIPDMKLIVEIDGERHKNKYLQDSNRDIKIRHALGDQWEIIRIPTEYIDQAPEKLPEAIKAIAKHKRDLRKKNGGFLPQSYSKREAARYKDAMVFTEINVPS